MSASFWNRRLHRWIAVVTAIPLLLIVLTGILLQFKKVSDWIQPPTRAGSGTELSLSLPDILMIARQVPESGIQTWDDIDRIDVRPGKCVVKVRGKNRWEIQVDGESGEILNKAYRRSDLIESLHDGSFFNDQAKLWCFFPVALLLLCLWGTGLYLFFLPWLRHKKNAGKKSTDSP